MPYGARAEGVRVYATARVQAAVVRERHIVRLLYYESMPNAQAANTQCYHRMRGLQAYRDRP